MTRLRRRGTRRAGWSPFSMPIDRAPRRTCASYAPRAPCALGTLDTLDIDFCEFPQVSPHMTALTSHNATHGVSR